MHSNQQSAIDAPAAKGFCWTNASRVLLLFYTITVVLQYHFQTKLLEAAKFTKQALQQRSRYKNFYIHAILIRDLSTYFQKPLSEQKKTLK